MYFLALVAVTTLQKILLFIYLTLQSEYMHSDHHGSQETTDRDAGEAGSTYDVSNMLYCYFVL